VQRAAAPCRRQLPSRHARHHRRLLRRHARWYIHMHSRARIYAQPRSYLCTAALVSMHSRARIYAQPRSCLCAHHIRSACRHEPICGVQSTRARRRRRPGSL
jgi:hypothetical protein